jgi:hypothetical protein
MAAFVCGSCLNKCAPVGHRRSGIDANFCLTGLSVENRFNLGLGSGSGAWLDQRVDLPMATRVIPINVEKLEFDVSSAREPLRATIVTGNLPSGLQVLSNSPSEVTQSISLSALVDPTVLPGQFRKAAATAALASTGSTTNAGPAPSSSRFSIDGIAFPSWCQRGAVAGRTTTYWHGLQ